MTSSQNCWAVWNWTKLTVGGPQTRKDDDEEDQVYWFTEEQITYALQQVEGGTPAADVCRQLGCGEASFYIWKKRYGSMGTTEVRELRQRKR